MAARGRILVNALLILLPVLAGTLWLASGRQVITKATRVVRVEVKNEDFGDTDVRDEFVPGPIFGYYVGLDAVAMVTGACVAAGGVRYVLNHRRKPRAGFPVG